MKRPSICRRRFLQYVAASGVSAGLANLAILGNGIAQYGGPAVIGRTAARRRLDEGQPSATAQNTAMLRAAHQVLDDPRVFDDPLALGMIGAANEATLLSNPERYQTPRFLAPRAFVAMRSRYAEDALAQAIQRGVGQYVILGAGLDTFAYRNPYPALEVFEVDHPATQAWKRNRLREAGIAVPDSLTFAPVDFEEQTLAEGLRRAGFRADQPAFFSWLGVVIYLTKAAVMDTLRFVASSTAPGSEIVFDFALPTSLLSEQERGSRELRANRVAAIGEPWLTFFEPSSLAGELADMGFTHIEIVGPAEANQRYFSDRGDDLYVRGSNHLVRARI